MTTRFYLVTYTNGTTTVQHELGGRSRKSVRLAAADLAPRGYTVTGQPVPLTDW